MQEHDRFNQAVECLLASGNPEYTSLSCYVQQRLYQYKLINIYKVEEILNIAYYRSVKAIDKGVVVENPPAWLRRVSLRVIQELSRERARLQSLDDETPFQPCTYNTALYDEIRKTDFKTILIALKRLKPEYQEILCLRIIEEKSWREIRDLVSGNAVIQREGTLRQHGFRAIRQLRRIYEELRLEQENKN